MSLYLLRKKIGIPIKEIAGKMGVHPSYYSHLESGRRKFNDDLITRLAMAIGVDTDVVKKEVEKIENKTFETPGWIASIKIHGINSLKSFENYLSLNSTKIEITDLKKMYAEFVEQNIAMSIMSEFESNQDFSRMFNFKFSKVLEKQ